MKKRGKFRPKYLSFGLPAHTPKHIINKFLILTKGKTRYTISIKQEIPIKIREYFDKILISPFIDFPKLTTEE